MPSRADDEFTVAAGVPVAASRSSAQKAGNTHDIARRVKVRNRLNTVVISSLRLNEHTKARLLTSPNENKARVIYDPDGVFKRSSPIKDEMALLQT